MCCAFFKKNKNKLIYINIFQHFQFSFSIQLSQVVLFLMQMDEINECKVLSAYCQNTFESITSKLLVR